MTEAAVTSSIAPVRAGPQEPRNLGSAQVLTVPLQTYQMLDLLFKPLRSVLGFTEHEIETLAPFEETEEDILNAVKAIHRATDSIEHHVEVIEGLATSVAPLTDSVNQLTATMQQLVVLLAPMGAAEHGIQRAERFFGRHRHEP